MGRTLLMTPTLWNSIDWLQKCPPSWKEKAYTDLSNTLNRIFTSNPAVERGMSFERDICNKRMDTGKYDVAADLNEKYEKAFNMIHAEGYGFQHKTKKIMSFDGKDFLLYGKMDVFNPEGGPVIDIKTTGNFKGDSSYLSGWQHKVYCYCTERDEFIYIVYELTDLPGNIVALKDIHFVEYKVTSFAVLEEELRCKLESVVKFLRSDVKLKEAYMRKFNQY